MPLTAQPNFYCNRRPSACAQWCREVFQRGLPRKKMRPKHKTMKKKKPVVVVPRVQPQKLEVSARRQGIWSERAAKMTDGDRDFFQKWNENIQAKGAELWSAGTRLQHKAMTCWRMLKSITHPLKISKRHIRGPSYTQNDGELVPEKVKFNTTIEDLVNCVKSLPDAQRRVYAQRRQDWLHSMWQKVYAVADQNLGANPHDSKKERAFTRIAKAIDRFFWKSTIRKMALSRKYTLSWKVMDELPAQDGRGGLVVQLEPLKKTYYITIPGLLRHYGKYPNHHDRDLSVVVSSWKHHLCHHIGLQMLVFVRKIMGYKDIDQRNPTYLGLCNEWVYGHGGAGSLALPTTPSSGIVQQLQPRRR